MKKWVSVPLPALPPETQRSVNCQEVKFNTSTFQACLHPLLSVLPSALLRRPHPLHLLSGFSVSDHTNEGTGGGTN